MRTVETKNPALHGYKVSFTPDECNPHKDGMVVGEVLYKEGSRNVLGTMPVESFSEYLAECLTSETGPDADTQLERLAEHFIGTGEECYVHDLAVMMDDYENAMDAFSDWLPEYGPDALTGDIIDALQELGYFVAPAYAYVHSGTALSLSPFSCRWDSGQFGYYLVTPEDFKREGIETENVVEWAESNFGLWARYVSGDWHFVTVFDAEGDVIHSEGGYSWDCFRDQPEGPLAPYFAAIRGAIQTGESFTLDCPEVSV